MYKYFLLAVIVSIQACTDANWQTAPQPPSPAQAVEAQKFVLVNAEGKPIAELGAAQGGAGLVLMDSAGKPRAALVLTQAGEPGLKLYDPKGVVRAALVVANDGRSGLALYDGKNKNRAALATDPDGAPLLVLFDRDGRIIKVLAAPSAQRDTVQRPPSG